MENSVGNLKNDGKMCLRFLEKLGKLKSVDEHPHKHKSYTKIEEK